MQMRHHNTLHVSWCFFLVVSNDITHTPNTQHTELGTPYPVINSDDVGLKDK